MDPSVDDGDRSTDQGKLQELLHHLVPEEPRTIFGIGPFSLEVAVKQSPDNTLAVATDQLRADELLFAERPHPDRIDSRPVRAPDIREKLITDHHAVGGRHLILLHGKVVHLGVRLELVPDEINPHGLTKFFQPLGVARVAEDAELESQVARRLEPGRRGCGDFLTLPGKERVVNIQQNQPLASGFQGMEIHFFKGMKRLVRAKSPERRGNALLVKAPGLKVPQAPSWRASRHSARALRMFAR